MTAPPLHRPGPPLTVAIRLGVKDSLIKTLHDQPAGAPDGRYLDSQPWTHTTFNIVLAPSEPGA